MLVLVADDDFRMRALFDVLQQKLIKRGVSVKNLTIGDIKPAGGDTVRREITLKTALDGETAKKIAAAIKDAKMKKVQAVDPGRAGARHLAVQGRPAGGHRAAPRPGFRRRAQVRELPLEGRFVHLSRSARPRLAYLPWRTYRVFRQ